MRVLVVASEYPPYLYGGLGTHVTALTRELAGQGMDVELAVPSRGSYDTPPRGVRLQQVPMDGVDANEGNVNFWVTFCAGVLDLVVRLGEAGRAYDLVHCHDWMTAAAGVAVRGTAHIPLVFSVHLPQASQPNLTLEMLGIAAADLTFASSSAVRDELVVRNPDLPRSLVIASGVDVERFVPADAATTPSGQQILFAGRLVAQKGVDILLRSFAAIRRRFPDARLLIAGDGDQALYLRRLGRYFGLPPQVEFLGWKTGSDLVTLYQTASVVAVPSRYEPFGLVALEAMACGRPIVASRIGGLTEIVCDGETGFLVPPGDHLRLAQRVAALLLDGDQRRIIGDAARQRALDYRWSRIATLTREQYRSVVATSRGSPVQMPALERWSSAALGVLPPHARAVMKTLLSAPTIRQGPGREVSDEG